MIIRLARLTAAAALCLAVPALLSAQGNSIQQTIQEVLSRHAQGSDAPKDFEIREDEANHYIRENGHTQLPDGIESPWVRFDQQLAIVGATLDLDKLEGSLPDSAVFSLLTGRVPVEVTARLNALGGIGKLDLEKVMLAGVELPPDIVQSLVKDYDTSKILPRGFQLGAAFPLPFDLESVLFEPGAIKIRQRATGK